MNIGVDFDNTIIRYDDVFHVVARERGLIPPDLPRTKNGVRDYLRTENRENEWTELQGLVYGTCLDRCSPFPGVLDFFRMCRARAVAVAIISHKTPRPYRGQAYDLQAAARTWLDAQGFHAPHGGGLPDTNVFMEPTKQDKLARIAALSCSHFIDDLPEFLIEPAFPVGTQRILFDPNNAHPNDNRYARVRSWAEITTLLPGKLSP